MSPTRKITSNRLPTTIRLCSLNGLMAFSFNKDMLVKWWALVVMHHLPTSRLINGKGFTVLRQGQVPKKCTVFSFASDHRKSEGLVLQLKMVASVGNAPTFCALQAHAHLSKPRSLFKIVAFGATREASCLRTTNPLCLISILYYTVSFAARRILRTLGLLWLSLVMNRCCYVSNLTSFSALSTSFFNYLENRFRCKDG